MLTAGLSICDSEEESSELSESSMVFEVGALVMTDFTNFFDVIQGALVCRNIWSKTILTLRSFKPSSKLKLIEQKNIKFSYKGILLYI